MDELGIKRILGRRDQIDVKGIFEKLKIGKINVQITSLNSICFNLIDQTSKEITFYSKQYRDGVVEQNQFLKKINPNLPDAKLKKIIAKKSTYELNERNSALLLTTRINDFYECIRLYFLFKLVTNDDKNKCISYQVNTTRYESYKNIPEISKELKIILEENVSQLSQRYFNSNIFKNIKNKILENYNSCTEEEKIGTSLEYMFLDEVYQLLRLFRNFISHGDSTHALTCISVTTIKEIEFIIKCIINDLNMIEFFDEANKMPVHSRGTRLQKELNKKYDEPLVFRLNDFFKG